MILIEARRLWDLGCGVHWLKAKSKEPINPGWSKGERASFQEINSQYRPGMNLGIRLGALSPLIGGGYLAVLDVDVKSMEARHRKEASDYLKKNFPGISATPTVTTGRGGGSRHFYLRSAAPLPSRKLTASGDLIEVRMPSVKPTTMMREKLGEEKIVAGWRIRPAWEIEIMSIGRQVAAPPSIHPDTDKHYAWARAYLHNNALLSAESFPLLKGLGAGAGGDLGGRPDPGETGSAESSAFQALNVCLGLYALPQETVRAIERGEGVVDRSAACFTAAQEMVRVGMIDDEILSVLTDRALFLGQVAYEHAGGTGSRVRAAEWARKYCLKKARKVDAAVVFERSAVIENAPLGAEAVKAQLAEIEAGRSWMDDLDRTAPGKGGEAKLRATLKNVDLILTNSVGKAPVFRRNEFSNRDIYGAPTPWGGRTGEELSDLDAVLIKRWLAWNWKIEPSVTLVFEAMALLSIRNAFHPVRDYLRGLPPWDGVPRIDFWLRDYLRAEAPEPYLSEISRKVLCAMVARVMRPGIKFDHALVLEGAQGIGKSSAAAILAGDDWFCDTLPDLRHPDARLNLQGKWIIEWGELVNLRRNDMETAKAFMTTRIDRVRAPYGRKAQDLSRQCIFIGTTNEGEYLKDKTGNRRFWPVKVGACQFDRFKAARDQLFAEALFMWEVMGERLWLTPEISAQAHQEQMARVSDSEEDLMFDKLTDFITQENMKPEAERAWKNGLKITDLFGGDVGTPPPPPYREMRADNWKMQLAAKCLIRAKFTKYISAGRIRWKLIDLNGTEPPTTIPPHHVF